MFNGEHFQKNKLYKIGILIFQKLKKIFSQIFLPTNLI